MMSNNTYTEEREEDSKTSEVTSSVVTAIVVLITLGVIYWMPA